MYSLGNKTTSRPPPPPFSAVIVFQTYFKFEISREKEKEICPFAEERLNTGMVHNSWKIHYAAKFLGNSVVCSSK